MSMFISGAFKNITDADSAIDSIVGMNVPSDLIGVMLNGKVLNRIWNPTSRMPLGNDAQTHQSAAKTLGEILREARMDNGQPVSSNRGVAESDRILGGLAAEALSAQPAYGTKEKFLNTFAQPGIDPNEAQVVMYEVKSGYIVVGITTNDDQRAAVELILMQKSVRAMREAVNVF